MTAIQAVMGEILKILNLSEILCPVHLVDRWLQVPATNTAYSVWFRAGEN